MQLDDSLSMRMVPRWDALGLSRSIYKQLSHMYYEPQRVYHTLYHIDDLLTKQELYFPDVHHMSYPGADVICDLDLSGLGDPPDKYDQTTAKVRAEYGRYSDEQWAIGRKKFLASFLARPKIFHTETFAYPETQARENLSRELSSYE